MAAEVVDRDRIAEVRAGAGGRRQRLQRKDVVDEVVTVVIDRGAALDVRQELRAEGPERPRAEVFLVNVAADTAAEREAIGLLVGRADAHRIRTDLVAAELEVVPP